MELPAMAGQWPKAPWLPIVGCQLPEERGDRQPGISNRQPTIWNHE
jgi:hypothetical protein